MLSPQPRSSETGSDLHGSAHLTTDALAADGVVLRSADICIDITTDFCATIRQTIHCKIVNAWAGNIVRADCVHVVQGKLIRRKQGIHAKACTRLSRIKGPGQLCFLLKGIRVL